MDEPAVSESRESRSARLGAAAMSMGDDRQTNTRANDAEVRNTLQGLLSDHLRRSVRILSLTREPSPFATLFPAEVVSLTLDGGGQLSIFIKSIGSEQADHPEKACRDREVMIYERLFTDPSLPVPRYLGSRRDHSSGRRDIYLEFLDGWNLKYQPLDHWFTAARRLAQLHVHFLSQGHDLLASDFLLKFDASYFEEWAERALLATSERFRDLGDDLKRVIDAYGSVAELLATQPTTLVHNDPSPKNVVADPSTDPARICFVDWEMAGVGCGLLDLTHLKYGLDPASESRMISEYANEAQGTGLLPEDERERGILLAACELHKTLYRLAFNGTWNLPKERVALWVDEAGGFFRQAQALGAGC